MSFATLYIIMYSDAQMIEQVKPLLETTETYATTNNCPSPPLAHRTRNRPGVPALSHYLPRHTT